MGNSYVAIAGHTAASAASQMIDQRDDGFLNFNQYSEELRLTSPSGGNLEYVLGGFLWHTKEYDTFTRTDNFCSDSTLAVDATGFQPCSTAAGKSTFVTSSGPAAWTTTFNNVAAFGQATYKLTSALKLIADNPGDPALKRVLRESNKLFGRIDLGHKGYLNRHDFEKDSVATFNRQDRNHDGWVTRAECMAEGSTPPPVK